MPWWWQWIWLGMIGASLLGLLGYHLRLYALLSGQRYLAAYGSEGGAPRFYLRSPWPLLLLGIGLIVVVPLVPALWGAAGVAGRGELVVRWLVAVGVLGVVGGHGQGLRFSPLAVVALLIALLAFVVQAIQGRPAADLLPPLLCLAPFLLALVVVFVVRRGLVGAIPPLHARRFVPVGGVLLGGLALFSAADLVVELLTATPSNGASFWLPAIAFLVLGVVVLWRGLFGLLYLLASLTGATVALDGRGHLQAHYRLCGVPCWQQRWRRDEIAGLALHVYGYHTMRRRSWHGRLFVFCSELVLCHREGHEVPLAYVEGLATEEEDRPSGAADAVHPAFAAFGEALAASLGVPWEIKGVSRTIMPGCDVRVYGDAA